MSNARSMKALEGNRNSNASATGNQTAAYQNKISILQKPGVRASQNLPSKQYDPNLGQYTNKNNSASTTPLSPQENDKQSNASVVRRNVLAQRGSNRSSSNAGGPNRAGDALERQIQAELNHRRVTNGNK